MPTYKFSRRSKAKLEVIIRSTLDKVRKNLSVTLTGLKNGCSRSLKRQTLVWVVGDFAIGLHGFVYQSQVIYYFEAKHGVTIVRVLHQRMNPTLHL